MDFRNPCVGPNRHGCMHHQVEAEHHEDFGIALDQRDKFATFEAALLKSEPQELPVHANIQARFASQVLTSEH